MSIVSKWRTWRKRKQDERWAQMCRRTGLFHSAQREEGRRRVDDSDWITPAIVIGALSSGSDDASASTPGTSSSDDSYSGGGG